MDTQHKKDVAVWWLVTYLVTVVFLGDGILTLYINEELNPVLKPLFTHNPAYIIVVKLLLCPIIYLVGTQATRARRPLARYALCLWLGWYAAVVVLQAYNLVLR